MPVAGGHLGKKTLHLAVGEGLGIGLATYGPVLPGELVIGIIDLSGLDKSSAAAVPYTAVVQPAQGVIIIGVGIAGLAVGDPVELTVAGVGVGKDPSVGIGGGLSTA